MDADWDYLHDAEFHAVVRQTVLHELSNQAEIRHRIASSIYTYVTRCPVHSVPEPCPTCSAYIAAGL